MAVFEWAREPEHLERYGYTNDMTGVYGLIIARTHDFHNPPADWADEDDLVTSAQFPYVYSDSYRRLGPGKFAPAGLAEDDQYHDEQYAAYAKSLEVVTAEVAEYQNLPAFMGAVLLK